MALAALGTMLAPLNSTMIVVALPEITADFGRELAWGSWIVISYLVAMAAVQPLGGSLGDRYGQRRLVLIGLTLFLAATVGCALAPNIELLILARTAQAISGASVIPNGTALVRTLLPQERQGRAFGTIGSAIAVAAAAGPPLGGLVTDGLGWRWIFAANVLLIAPAIALAARLPADRPARQGRFDLAGAGLLLLTLVSLALALTAWRLSGVPVAAGPLLALLAVGGGLLLRRRVRGHPAPVLDLSLFSRPGFTPAALTVMLSNLAMYTLLLSLPVFLTEHGDGWSSTRVGLLLAGLSLQMVVVSPAGGWLSDRFGRQPPAVAGTLLIAVGLLPLVALRPSWGWALLVPLVLVGIGIGLSAAAVQAAAVEAAPRGQTGQAAGLFSTMRYLGSIVGSAGMAAILIGSPPPVGSFRLLYALLVLAASAASVAAFALPRAQPLRDGAAVPQAAPARRG